MEGRGPASVASAAPPASTITVLLGIVLAILALYFGREILQPLTLAILFSFALAPLVKRLRKWGVPRIAAVVGTVLLAFVILLGFGAAVSLQLVDLAYKLPEYEQNVLGKIRGLHAAAPKNGLIAQITTLGGDLGKALTEASGDQGGPNTATGQRKPVPVEVQDKPSPLRTVQRILGPILGPAATAGIVIVFTVFVLLQRQDLCDRRIRLTGAGDLKRTTRAIDDAARRLSRYL